MAALEEGADVEEVSQDLSAMSREEKLQVLMSDAPELVELLQSFKETVVQIRTQIAPLIPSDVALPIVHASQVVEMGESPSKGVRTKKDASILVAARLVKEGEACALVSCGNTGAVMAASLMELGRVKGVERPAITTVVPRRRAYSAAILATVVVFPTPVGPTNATIFGP